MQINLSPLEIDFLLRELTANQGMISPSASIPAWYRHTIQGILREALMLDRRRVRKLQDTRIQERENEKT